MRALGLSGRQIVELSKKLRSRYAILWSKVSSEGGFTDVAGPADVHDAQDEAYVDERQEERLAEVRREHEELADIEQALACIHEESYGVCSECGAPIGYKRLEAYPTAKRCLPCQRRQERRQHQSGH